jgi:hypothetical protein
MHGLIRPAAPIKESKMNGCYAPNFIMTLRLLLCTVLFCVPFVYASLPTFNDSYILTLDSSDSPSCNTRTLWDILSSCGLTLFACTWTAVHPDIPRIDKGIVAITFHRLLLMVIAFLAPELVTAWAAWQLLCARQATKDFVDAGFGAQHAKPHCDRRVWWRKLVDALLSFILNSSRSSGDGQSHTRTLQSRRN